MPDTDILIRTWPAAKPKAALLLVHGLGAQTGRWEFLGNHGCKSQIASFAIELKGFGATTTPQGHIDSFRTYDQDIVKVAEHIQRLHPGVPVFLVGESMGGMMAFNLAASRPGLFQGIILICPVFKSRLSFSLADYWTVFSSLLWNPKKTITLPFASSMCTRDEVYQKKLDADPHELRVASAGLLIGILREQMRANRLARSLKDPILFLHAGQDAFGDMSASRTVFNRIPGQDKQFNLYPDMRHALQIDLGKETVFQDMQAWILKRM